MELINSIIGFIIAIGILVTFHEYGHYLVARMCDVRVLKFSVGFGKPIYSWISSKTNTEYSLCMIPLGGYVQMLESKNQDGHPIEIDENDHKYCFDKKSVYQRFAVVAAGPIFNLILAVIFFAITFMYGISGVKPKISLENNVYEVLSVNNNQVQRWQDVRVELLNNVVNQKKIILTLKDTNNNLNQFPVKYDSTILNKEGDIVSNIGLDIIYPGRDAIIGDVNTSDNNQNIKVDDRILSIDGRLVDSWNDFVSIIKESPEQKINIVALRDNKVIDYDARVLEKNGNGFLGVSKKIDKTDFVFVNYNLSDSLNRAITSTSDYTVLTFKMIGRLIIGEANVKNLSGPLSIAQFSGRSLEMGFSYFLYLLAILSVSLGVLNLLPIPMLDGGHLVYYLYEIVFGEELPHKVQLVAQFIGIALLGFIMIIAFYNDFVRIFS
ncbi:MAG: RIP metalloprotease RseP [Gammaproteobacteria bacterium]